MYLIMIWNYLHMLITNMALPVWACIKVNPSLQAQNPGAIKGESYEQLRRFKKV